MNNDEKKALALVAVDFLISNQLSLLRLTLTDSKITLSVPTVKDITEEDLIQILSNKFSLDSVTLDFEYINRASANGTTIIYINR